MTAAARCAYGQARARARYADIMSRPFLSAMVTAPGIGPLSGWRDLGPLDDGASMLTAVYRRLVDDYATMIAAYPDARDALAALVQLHELENIKLLWRAAVRRLAHHDWRASWRPLGPLQRIEAERFAAPFSQIELVAALARTPYARPAEASLRAHGADLAAAELAFDRFGSSRVAAARDRLPRAERSARALLRAVIARRDTAVFERAVTTLGVDPASAVLMTALGQALPIKPRERAPALARRVMMLEPFTLATPLALVLLREEEVHALLAVSEVRARHAPPAEARRALEAVIGME